MTVQLAKVMKKFEQYNPDEAVPEFTSPNDMRSAFIEAVVGN